MRRIQKSYETPVSGWQEERIESETQVRSDYGLTNKREIWKAQSMVRDFRRQARRLNANEDEDMEEELLRKLVNLGVLEGDAELNDVLDIDIESVLERRLQTLVYRRGLAETFDEARQLVNHGHIVINDRVVDVPGYLVTTAEEEQIQVKPGSQHIIGD